MIRNVKAYREFYAKLIVRDKGPLTDELVRAFSAVAREQFVGDGPWRIFSAPDGYIETPTADPRILYQDVLVALSRDQGINNGQPSLHGHMLAAVAPRAGERVLQVGTGTGYYSAILAELVGPEGTVYAYEIDPELAARAESNLADYSCVTVHPTSATEGPLPQVDIIYVNAGASYPLPLWLDALAVGGRLLFPLTGVNGVGVLLKVTRLEENKYAARLLLPVSFIDGIGARDETTAQNISAALERGNPGEVRSLRRDDRPDESSWCSGKGWWLSTSDPR